MSFIDTTGLAQAVSEVKAYCQAAFAALTHSHAASDITSGYLPVSRGGTGNGTAGSARVALGASRAFYCSCTTASSTATKEVTILDNEGLENGMVVCVHFTHANTANNPKLKIGTAPAVSIYAGSSSSASVVTWVDGETVPFVYNGTYFYMVGGVGVNALRESVSQDFTSSYFYDTWKLLRVGKFVMMRVSGLKSLTSNVTTVLATIPSGYRPAYLVRFDRFQPDNTMIRISVYPNGSLEVYAYSNTGHYNFSDTLTWFTD